LDLDRKKVEKLFFFFFFLCVLLLVKKGKDAAKRGKSLSLSVCVCIRGFSGAVRARASFLSFFDDMRKSRVLFFLLFEI